MKIRILNGGHAAIAYPAGLLDIHFVHEAMEDRADRDLPRDADQARDHPRRSAAASGRSRGLSQEGRRALRQPEDRRHDLATVPRRLEPAAEVHPADGQGPSRGRRGVKGLALVSAMWCRYCYGESESGKTIPPNDPSWDRLQARGQACAERSARLPRDARHLRRTRRRSGLRRRVLGRARLAVDERRARDARRLSRRQRKPRRRCKEEA